MFHNQLPSISNHNLGFGGVIGGMKTVRNSGKRISPQMISIKNQVAKYHQNLRQFGGKGFNLNIQSGVSIGVGNNSIMNLDLSTNAMERIINLQQKAGLLK